MRNFVARALVAGCTSAVALSLGSGLASAADPYIGKKYSEASASITKYNGTPVVATVSGSSLELDDCIVTSWSRSIFLDSSGSNARRGEYRLNLNCNNTVATPGHPGNSAMTPEGAKAKKDQTTAEGIAVNSTWCYKTDDILQWCMDICKRTGLCSLEES